MSIFFKKNAKNSRNIEADEIECESKLRIPRLTTTQRDANNYETGCVIWNTTTNEYQILDQLNNWQVVTVGFSPLNYVTTSTPQTITGEKTIDADLRFQLANNRHVLFRNDALDVFGYTHTNTSPFCMRFIASDDSTPAIERCIQYGYYSGNNRANSWIEKWKVKYEANNDAIMTLNNAQVLDGNSTSLKIGSHNNIVVNNVGLKIGDSVNPTSALHIKSSSPNLQIEANGPAQSASILMKGTQSNIYDYGFNNASMEMSTGTGKIEFKQGASTYALFDTVNKSVSFADVSAATLPKMRALFNSGINEDHCIGLPRVSSAGESSLITTIGVDPQYNGAVWYNSNTHEFRGMFNNTVHDILHAGSTDISEVNISGITSQVASINDAQTFTNKTINADLNTISNISNTQIKDLAMIDAMKIANGTVDNTEYQALNGVTSSIQAQLDSKVSLSGVEILTNKTFSDATTYFQDNVDDSKKLQFQLSGISTVTTRTLTIPDADTTIVGTDNITTLTNKTINADLNTITNIDNNEIKVGANIDALKIGTGLINNTEFNYLDGVTSNIQTQINAKLNNNDVTLPSSFVNSSLQNASSDTFNLLGQTNTDAILKIQRQTGEFINIESRQTAAVFRNNTQDLLQLNNTGVSVLVGSLNIPSGQQYKINNIAVPRYIGSFEYTTNSGAYVNVYNFVYTNSISGDTNYTCLLNPQATTCIVRIVNHSLGIVLQASPNLTGATQTYTFSALNYGASVAGHWLGLQCVKVSGSGSLSVLSLQQN